MTIGIKTVAVSFFLSSSEKEPRLSVIMAFDNGFATLG